MEHFVQVLSETFIHTHAHNMHAKGILAGVVSNSLIGLLPIRRENLCISIAFYPMKLPGRKKRRNRA